MARNILPSSMPPATEAILRRLECQILASQRPVVTGGAA